MSSIKTVLISTASLPHTGIGSWTTEMNYLLERENNIDYVIGPISTVKIEKPIQIFIGKRTFIDKLKCKIDFINRFNPYLRALEKVLAQDENIILQVKGNFGLLKAIVRYIEKRSLRKRIYVQYHYHSFLPFSLEEKIYNQIDELVLLTNTTYKVFQKSCNVLPIKVSINTDGVDSTDFKKVSLEEKNLLRKENYFSTNKLIFTWCSQDRKKKGLDLILEVWEQLLKEYGEELIQLNVIGLKRTPEVILKGVNFIGRIPNKKLNEYYQLSDFYLFPSLWQEGFGLSLLEALKSGCYCIASNNGAISEVLKKGDYGKLIKNPNFVDEWVLEVKKSIKEYLENNKENPFSKNIPKDLFDVSFWYKRYNENIVQAKKSFYLRNYLD